MENSLSGHLNRQEKHMLHHKSISSYKIKLMPIVHHISALLALICSAMVACSPHKAHSNTEQRFSDPTAPVGDALLSVPACVRPILNIWMRDTYVMYGPDGDYYLTGTTASPGRVFKGATHCWDYNDGIYLWRSADLKHWEALGRIWSFDKDAAPWQKQGIPVKPGTKSLNGDVLDSMYRAVWAPELHYIKSKKKWLIAACMNGNKGSFVLESISGKPQGPYRNIKGNEDKPIFNNIDLSIFEDTGGEVYLVGHNHFMARMNSALTNMAGPFRKLRETPYKKEPYIEGVWLDKHNGKYQLVQSIWSVRKPNGSYSYLRDQAMDKDLYSYDVVIAESDSLYGPFGPRYPAILGGGHNNFFKDKKGNWWSTVFFNPRGIMAKSFPVTCRPAILPLKWKDGSVTPDIKAAETFYSSINPSS